MHIRTSRLTAALVAALAIVVMGQAFQAREWRPSLPTIDLFERGPEVLDVDEDADVGPAAVEPDVPPGPGELPGPGVQDPYSGTTQVAPTGDGAPEGDVRSVAGDSTGDDDGATVGGVDADDDRGEDEAEPAPKPRQRTKAGGSDDDRERSTTRGERNRGSGDSGDDDGNRTKPRPPAKEAGDEDADSDGQGGGGSDDDDDGEDEEDD